MADVKIGGNFAGDLLIESGNVYFLYRAKGKGFRQSRQVGHLYVVLKPANKPLYRVLVCDRTNFPPGPETFRFAVSRIFRKPQDVREELGERRFETKIFGHRSLPSAVPLASGMYVIFMHERTSHFSYVVEMPAGKLDLNLRRAADYCICAINPRTEAPPRTIGPRAKIEFPPQLREKFARQQSVSVDQPDFLDFEGIEVEFSAPGDDGLTVEFPDREGRNADASRDLKLPYDTGEDPILEYKLR